MNEAYGRCNRNLMAVISVRIKEKWMVVHTWIYTYKCELATNLWLSVGQLYSVVLVVRWLFCFLWRTDNQNFEHWPSRLRSRLLQLTYRVLGVRGKWGVCKVLWGDAYLWCTLYSFETEKNGIWNIMKTWLQLYRINSLKVVFFNSEYRTWQ